MSDQHKLKFSFSSRALDSDEFWVVDFTGVEGLFQTYEFNLRLLSEKPDLDLEKILASPAVFTIHRDDRDVAFHGLVAEIEQDHAYNKMYFYRATLTPRLWLMKMTRHNQVFLDKNLKGFMSDVIQDGGLNSEDFDFRLTGEYKDWEYICQYGESHYDFLCRWMEREGLYYYFEQDDGKDKLIITDTRLTGAKRQGFSDLAYNPVSGLEDAYADNLVYEFSSRRTRIPNKVKIKDYNYRKPSLDLKSEAEVSRDGFGEVYAWGDHYETEEEGGRLAGIRAEGYKTGEVVFSGRSIAPFLAPGFLFKLDGHYLDDFNAEYLVTMIEHEGSQTKYLVKGLGLDADFGEERLHYRNRFKAIPSAVQFRPERRTPRPIFYGCLNARIDAEGSGEYAELDDQGRYKIKLPFDLAGRPDGKASCWVRMAEPSAGAGYGMHAPLHKGSEVLLTFLNGDPDRPIIAGAAPNPEDASPVTDENSTKNVMRTAGGSRLELNDEEGQERILMHTPKSNTWLRLGATNDPEPEDDEEEKDGWWGNTEHDTGIFIFGKCDTKVFRNVTEIVVGGKEKVVVLHEDASVLGMKTNINLGPRIKIEVPRKCELDLAELFAGEEENEAVEAKVHLVAQKIQAINDKKQAINDKISLIDQRAVAANSNNELVESKLQAMDESVAAYNSAVRAAEAKIEALEEKVRAVNTKVGENPSRIEKVQEYVAALNTCVEDATSKIDQINEEKLKMSALIREEGTIIKTG